MAAPAAGFLAVAGSGYAITTLAAENKLAYSINAPKTSMEPTWYDDNKANTNVSEGSKEAGTPDPNGNGNENPEGGRSVFRVELDEDDAAADVQANVSQENKQEEASQETDVDEKEKGDQTKEAPKTDQADDAKVKADAKNDDVEEPKEEAKEGTENDEDGDEEEEDDEEEDEDEDEDEDEEPQPPTPLYEPVFGTDLSKKDLWDNFNVKATRLTEDEFEDEMYDKEEDNIEKGKTNETFIESNAKRLNIEPQTNHYYLFSP